MSYDYHVTNLSLMEPTGTSRSHCEVQKYVKFTDQKRWQQKKYVEYICFIIKSAVSLVELYRLTCSILWLTYITSERYTQAKDTPNRDTVSLL
jgi:hypothetical protein